MNLIVATDENWAIGYQNELLIRISEDLKYFKKLTINNTVIMGRKTFESLPNKKPLTNRTNIILTNDINYKIDNAIICNSIDDVLKITENINNEVYIIGGEMIYKLFLPYVKKAYITKIYHKFKADRYLTNFINNDWTLINESPIYETENNLRYQFLVYQKR